jgi:predicted glycosyltransferase involved in capsule biosynthesis
MKIIIFIIFIDQPRPEQQTPFFKYDLVINKSQVYCNILKNLPEIYGISFCFVYNNNPEYEHFKVKAIEHYTKLITEIEYKGEIIIYEENMEEFDMSRARNKSMEKAKFNHLFMLDLDCYLSKNNVNNIINKFNTLEHCGIFNVKKDENTGNGLWFGLKEKLAQPGYDERFKKFYCEDTEYMMNNARIGVVPMLILEDFTILDHNRDYTNRFVPVNHGLFRHLLQQGFR